MLNTLRHRILLFIVVLFVAGTLSARRKKKGGWETNASVSRKDRTPIGYLYRISQLSNLDYGYIPPNETEEESRKRNKYGSQFYRLLAEIPDNRSNFRYLVIRFKARLFPGKHGEPQENGLLCHCFFSSNERCDLVSDVLFYLKLQRDHGLGLPYIVNSKVYHEALNIKLSGLSSKSFGQFEKRFYEDPPANWQAPGNYELKNIRIILDLARDRISVDVNGRKCVAETFIDFSKLNLKTFGIAWFWSYSKIPRKIQMPVMMEFSSPKIGYTDKLHAETMKPERYPYSSYLQDPKKYRNDGESDYAKGLAYFNGEGGFDLNYYQAVKYFRKASGDRHALARYMLGLCRYLGLGDDRDISSALRSLGKSADAGYAPANALAALLMYKFVLPKETNPFKIRRLELKTARYLKDARSQFDTNVFLAGHITGMQQIPAWIFGDDVAVNKEFKPFEVWNFNDCEKAKYHTLKSSLSRLKNKVEADGLLCKILMKLTGRYLPANYLYGTLLSHRKFTGFNLTKALKYLKKTLPLNYPPATMAYLRCKGLLQELAEEDFDPAICWCLYDNPEFFLLKQCMSAQNSECAKACFDGDFGFLKVALDSEDVPFKEFAQAYCMLYKAVSYKGKQARAGAEKFISLADKGNPAAQFLVSEIYDKGMGVIPNFNRTVYYLEKAAAQNLTAACLKLYDVYLTRKFNRDKAFYSLKDPCSHDIPEAWYWAGELLYAKQKFKKALACWEKAGKLGYTYAYYTLGRCYFNGVPGVTVRDKKKAFAYWKKFHRELFEKLDEDPHELLYTEQDYPEMLYDKNGLPFGWRAGKMIYIVSLIQGRNGSFLFNMKFKKQYYDPEYFNEDRQARLVRKFYEMQ